MKLTIDNECIGRDTMNDFLKALSKLMNEYVLASSNKIILAVPAGKYDDNGVFTVKVDIEFETSPRRNFGDKE